MSVTRAPRARISVNASWPGVSRNTTLRLLTCDVVRADVLRDAAGLALGDPRLADGVEQRRLAVVDVAHDGDDRRARDQVLRRGISSVSTSSSSSSKLRIWTSAPNSRAIIVAVSMSSVVLMRHHDPLVEQLLEDVLRADVELVGQILDGHALGQRDRARDRRRRGRRGRHRGTVRGTFPPARAGRGPDGRRGGASGGPGRAGARHVRARGRRRRGGPRARTHAAATAAGAARRSPDAAAAGGPCRRRHGRATGGAAAARGGAGLTAGWARRSPAGRGCGRRRRRCRARRRRRCVTDSRPASRAAASAPTRSRQRRRNDAGRAPAWRRRGIGGAGSRRRQPAPAGLAGSVLGCIEAGRRRASPPAAVSGDGGARLRRPRAAASTTGAEARASGGFDFGRRQPQRGAAARSCSRRLRGGARPARRRVRTQPRPAASRLGSTSGASTGLRPDRLDQPRRRQRRRRRLRRLDFLRGGRAFLPLAAGVVGEHVAAGQRDAALARQPLDELAGDDLLDRARRALHLDPVIALQQRDHFLAGRVRAVPRLCRSEQWPTVTSEFLLRRTCRLST